MHPLSALVGSHVQPGAPRHRLTRGMLFSVVLVFVLSMLFMRGGAAFAQLPPNTVFVLSDVVVYDGENHIEVAHDPSFELAEGTFA